MESIKAAFPDHSFLTEERQDKTNGSGSACRWIIDPLDGTTNYACGFPYFCVSLALEVSGQVELGVVYAPMPDELYYATRGGGAFMHLGRTILASNGALHAPILDALWSNGTDAH